MKEKLRSMLDTKEGWMAQKEPSTPRFHYIRNMMALCGGFGFYRGDLVPHIPGVPKGNDDCAKCFRLAPKVKP